MGAPLPAGVIGVGSLGYHHARLLAANPRASLVGVHDTDRERGASVAASLGTRNFDDLEELLARVEAVTIAVPTTDHRDVAVAALERGIHALIEKPIARTIAEADEILAAAQGSGALVATGHIERFNPVVRACEAYVEEPLFVESHRLAQFGPRGLDVAVVLDLMIHDIDLVLGLINQPVEQVSAVGVPVLSHTIDIANARLQFTGGGVANITASRVSQQRLRKVRIFQRSGYLSLDLGERTGEFLRVRPGTQLSGALDFAKGIEGLVERIPFVGDDVEPLAAELDSFLSAVLGEAPLVVDGVAGRRALKVALDIVESIRSNVSDPRSA